MGRYGFDPKPSPPKLLDPYRSPDVLGAIAISEMTEAFIEYASPGTRVWRVQNSIDPTLFHPKTEKVPGRIAFMPRKNAEHSSLVLRLLAVRGALDDVDVVPIDGLPLEAVAEIMRTAEVFLSFGYPEGFGLPPAEAMASGCVVVGYHGEGGREYFDPDFCYPVTFGDVVEFARTVEAVLAQFRIDRESMRLRGKRASEYITTRYSREREEAGVVAAWRQILDLRDRRIRAAA